MIDPTKLLNVVLSGPALNGRLLRLVLVPAAEGGYVAACPDDIGLHTEGDTVGACVDMAVDAAAALAEARKGLPT